VGLYTRTVIMGYYYFMPLSPKSIEEFKKIYKEEFGVELTNLEAEESAIKLVKYFELLMRIDKRLTKPKSINS